MASISATRQRKVAKAALNAKTLKEAQELEAILAAAGATERRPMGDNEDNFGAIHASSDPRLAIVERPTNSIDSVLEMEARLVYGTDYQAMAADLPTPAIAAEKLLGVPLGGPAHMRRTARQKLADRMQLTFVESGATDRPTAFARDAGIGQTPSRLPQTILSIHRGNKRGLPFLMGVFGWGGANTLGFSRTTIVVSRRHPRLLDGSNDGVGVTVVKQIYESGMRTPAYFYSVDKAGQVLSFDPSFFQALGFDYGTHIAHIEYDLNIRGPLINQFNFVSAALFRPVVPIYLGSYRKVDSYPGRRTVIGTGGRLNLLASTGKEEDGTASSPKVAYFNSAILDLGAEQGSVGISYWVLARSTAKPSDEIATGFVSPDNAITVTLNGQRQDAEKREWLKRVCKFPHLYRRMVVEISTDTLTQEAKVETFASTRERMRKHMQGQIFEPLAALLQGDGQLERLEEILREEALKHTAERASDRDLEKLQKAIGKLGGRTKEIDVDVEIDVDGPKHRRGGPTEPRDISDDNLPIVPTIFEFDIHDLTIEQGGARKRVMVSINAKNGYLPDHEANLEITVDGPAGKTRDVFPTARTALLGGKAQWLLNASEEAPTGDYKLTAVLRVGAVDLSDTLIVTVLEGGSTKTGGTGSRGTLKRRVKQRKEVPAGPQVNWVRAENWDDYPAEDYGPATVGHVDEGAKGVDIYLNLDFDKLQEVLQNPRNSLAVIEARKSAYMVPTALGLYRINQLDNDYDIDSDALKRMRTAIAHSVLLATDLDGTLVDDDG